MQFIVDFFNTISNIIRSLIDFFVDIVLGIGNVVSLIEQYVNNISSMFSWLPTTVISVVVSLFIVVGLYKFLGREG